MSSDFVKDEYCFACGKRNTHGLHMNVIKKDDGVEAVIRLPQWTQSYPHTVHGGIIATILDEMAVWAAYHQGYNCVTAELLVRIKKSMALDRTYCAQARIVNKKHRFVAAESTVRDEQKNIVAYATAKLMKVNQ